VRAVGVPVTGRDRALDFCAGTLGLEKRPDVRFGDGRLWIEVAPGRRPRSRWWPRAQSAGHDIGIRLATADAAAKARRPARPGR